ncbi:MAG: serine hydrolase domain-containing protein [Pyrinomonadaceae bacterium]
MKKVFVSFAVLFALVLNFFTAVPAHAAAPLGNLPANMVFDEAKFSSYIDSKLAGNTVGYAMVLYKDGKWLTQSAAGYSVLKKDVPSILGEGLSLRPETRMNIASVTKPITATAVLKALQVNPNVSLDSKVADFLPKNWTIGPGVKDLSFKDFMSQYTGMNDNKGFTDIVRLRQWIKDGVTRPKSEYKYINGNLAIFRIALPYLVATASERKNYDYLAASDDIALNNSVSDKFIEIVRNTVFTPMGITNVSMNDTGEYQTRFYNKNNNAAGSTAGDWSKKGGGGGWYMSALELGKFMANLRYNDNILAPSTRKLMDDNFLGWQDTAPTAWPQLHGKYGDYRGHGGLLKWNDDDPNKRTGMVSVIVNFPSGIQGVLLINSFGSYPNKEQLMTDAFDQAVVLKPAKKA